MPACRAHSGLWQVVEDKAGVKGEELEGDATTHLTKDRLPPIPGPHGHAFQKTDLQPPAAPCLGLLASGTRSIFWGSAAGKLQAHEALKAGGGELADRFPSAGPGRGRGSRGPLDFPSSQNQPGTRSNRSAGPATSSPLSFGSTETALWRFVRLLYGRPLDHRAASCATIALAASAHVPDGPLETGT